MISERKPSPRKRRGLAHLVLLGIVTLWLGFIGLSLLPNDWGSIRVAGVSLDWWYGGVVAPLLVVGLIVVYPNNPSSRG